MNSAHSFETVDLYLKSYALHYLHLDAFWLLKKIQSQDDRKIIKWSEKLLQGN
jgi:hypothetical protein